MGATRFIQGTTSSGRMVDFGSHLRANGFYAGLPETEQSLRAMSLIDLSHSGDMRMALKAIYCQNADGHARFDDLFDAFWLNSGRQRDAPANDSESSRKSAANIRNILNDAASSGTGALDAPDDGGDQGESAATGEGKLIGTLVENSNLTDFREYVREEDKAAAEDAARRLAHAIRYRRSRRRKANARAGQFDLRKMIRRSTSRGGEPLDVVRKNKQEKPTRLVLLLDVSGSMESYARVFLAFARGLMGQDQATDAYLFNTRLMRITDVMRDKDTLRALNKLSIMARGFGGGTRIGHCLDNFVREHGAKALTSRSVVIVMSDGYDTGPTDAVAGALARMKRKGCRLVWLNPLLGWKGYEPVSACMQAALPWVDAFAACNTLASLGAIEKELSAI